MPQNRTLLNGQNDHHNVVKRLTSNLKNSEEKKKKITRFFLVNHHELRHNPKAHPFIKIAFSNELYRKKCISNLNLEFY